MWWVGKIPWRRETLPTPVFWPREFPGVYSPWGGKESDKTGWLNTNSHEVSPFVKQRYQQYLLDSVHVQLLIRVQLFAALWTVAPRSSILYGIFQARILKWVAISSSRGSCPPRDWTQVSCTSYIGWWVLFCWTTWETSQYITGYPKGLNLESGTRDILTGDVNIQSYVIIAHMIMEWPCSQRRKNSLSKSN